MPWYGRKCDGCGRDLAASTDDPSVQVLCMSCDPDLDLVTPRIRARAVPPGQTPEKLEAIASALDFLDTVIERRTGQEQDTDMQDELRDWARQLRGETRGDQDRRG